MSEQEPAQQPAPPQKKITINIPKDLNAAYSNMAFISHTPVEMIFDFAQVLPRAPRGSVVARVLMTPMHAKLLLKALQQNVSNYERQYGEIRIPHQASPLADDFFRFTQPGQGDGEDGDE